MWREVPINQCQACPQCCKEDKKDPGQKGNNGIGRIRKEREFEA